jgi:glycosyltransferase involved in cell wall biosynthesis
LIKDRVTGLLVPPDDPDELASAIERLMTEPALRLQLGAVAARHVRQTFDSSVGIATLCELLALSLGKKPSLTETRLAG